MVLSEESKKMVNAVKVNGGKAKLTVYEDINHDAWTKTFQNPEVWKWLLRHKSKYQAIKSVYDNVEEFG